MVRLFHIVGRKTRSGFSCPALLLMSSLFAVFVLGCDAGSRNSVDEGFDAGTANTGGDTDTDTDTDIDTDTDTDTDSDLDAGAQDASYEEDASWREKDAGDFWQDDEINIETPCNNSCLYVYDLESDSWGARGDSYFEIKQDDPDYVNVRGLDSVRFIFFINMSKYYGHVFNERLVTELKLDAKTLALREGEAFVYDYWTEVETSRKYSFKYDPTNQTFSYTLEMNGRRWARTLASDTAPLIMFNYREYPNETWGTHSSLFAYLVGKSFDWDGADKQEIRIFSPEVERLETLVVEKDSAAENRLIIHFPVDSLKPPKTTYSAKTAASEVGTVLIDYKYDIPLQIGALYEYKWYPISTPPFEISIPEMADTTEVQAPVMPTGFTSSSVQISAQNTTLAGEIDDPSDTGPHPVVVLIPGWDHMTRLGEIGAIDMYSQLAAHLAAAGYLVLRTDARGKGGSAGNLTTATLDNLADDVLAMVGSLASNTEADTTQVFLLAEGIGAHVAAAAMREPGSSISGAILLSPFARAYGDWCSENYSYYLENAGFVLDEENAEEDLGEMKENIESIIASLKDGSFDGQTWRGHTPTSWQSILDEDLIEDSSGVEPALILVGKEDHLVLPSMGVDLHGAMQDAGVDSTLFELDGLSHALTQGTAEGSWPEHGAMETVHQNAIDAIVNWLDTQTGGTK